MREIAAAVGITEAALYAERGAIRAEDAPRLARTLVDLEFGIFMDRLLMVRGDEGEQRFMDSPFRARLLESVRTLVG